MDLWNYLGSNKYNTSAFSIVLDLPIDLTNFKEELNEFQFSLYLHEYTLLAGYIDHVWTDETI